MNKVILKGNLVEDPENKSTDSCAITKFRIAVQRRYSKKDEEKQTDFFNCTAFNKTAEFIVNYFKKGQQILIEGRLENQNWETTDDSGLSQKHHATNVIIENVEFCGKKEEFNQGDANEEPTTAEKELNKAGIEFETPKSEDDLPF